MPFDETVAARVRKQVARRRGVEERRMFGGVAYLREGRMFVGVVGSDLMVRVGKQRSDEALARPHVRPMDFTGRPLEGYVFVAPEGFATDRALTEWIEIALENVATLPPPDPKRKRP